MVPRAITNRVCRGKLLPGADDGHRQNTCPRSGRHVKRPLFERPDCPRVRSCPFGKNTTDQRRRTSSCARSRPGIARATHCRSIAMWAEDGHSPSQNRDEEQRALGQEAQRRVRLQRHDQRRDVQRALMVRRHHVILVAADVLRPAAEENTHPHDPEDAPRPESRAPVVQALSAVHYSSEGRRRDQQHQRQETARHRPAQSAGRARGRAGAFVGRASRRVRGDMCKHLQSGDFTRTDRGQPLAAARQPPSPGRGRAGAACRSWFLGRVRGGISSTRSHDDPVVVECLSNPAPSGGGGRSPPTVFRPRHRPSPSRAPPRAPPTRRRRPHALHGTDDLLKHRRNQVCARSVMNQILFPSGDE